MSNLTPEFEYVDRAVESVRYLEHGWPTDLVVGTAMKNMNCT